MNSTTALPPKAAHVTCLDCGLSASSPIVVAMTTDTGGNRVGRCSNRKACDLRLLRKLNREKGEKS